MTNYSFGIVDQFIFFGGGQILYDALARLNSSGKKVLLVTSRRHYNSLVWSNGKTIELNVALDLIDVPCELIDNIDADSLWKKNITIHTIGISVSAEWIFSRKLIDLFHGRLVNIHGSILPAMKGGGGVSWNIMMGLKEGGCTVHFVDEGIDTGDILMQVAYDYPAEYELLEDFLIFSRRNNTDLLISFIDKCLKKEIFIKRKQIEVNESYWPRIDTNIHGFIDWSWFCKDIASFISAFGHPYSGATTFLGEIKVRFFEPRTIDQSIKFHPFQYGIIFHISDWGLHIASNGGVLVVKSIVDESGKNVSLKGLLGSRFYTPHESLESAMRTRVIFNTKIQ
jgi:methionyl-tRNA formyltransferase